jgi:hypothetical protein
VARRNTQVIESMAETVCGAIWQRSGIGQIGVGATDR